MHIFISCSRPRSEGAARSLKALLRSTFGPAASVFVSMDIPPGERWADRIATELQRADFGVLCLTPGNFRKEWVLFEAGALAKLSSARVVPYLLDPMPEPFKSSPLGQYQSVSSDRDGTFSLLKSINRFQDAPLAERSLERSFNKAWPQFAAALHELPRDQPEQPALAPDSFLSEHPWLRRFGDHASQWTFFEMRYRRNPPLKRAIADFVLDLYFGLLTGAGISHWYFDNGSTVAYFAEALAGRLAQVPPQRCEIETNHIPIFLELLYLGANVTLFPGGRPETRFGATFGPLALLPEAPLGAPQRITGQARESTSQVRDHFIARYRDHGLIFTGASGFEITGLIRGPHVGGYPSMLHKRALLESGCPVMFLLDESKVYSPVIETSCRPLCDEDFPWREVCRNRPLAVACAFATADSARQTTPLLQALGFVHLERSKDADRPWCVIASNDCFHAARERWRLGGGSTSRKEIPSSAPSSSTTMA